MTLAVHCWPSQLFFRNSISGYLLSSCRVGFCLSGCIVNNCCMCKALLLLLLMMIMMMMMMIDGWNNDASVRHRCRDVCYTLPLCELLHFLHVPVECTGIHSQELRLDENVVSQHNDKSFRHETVRSQTMSALAVRFTFRVGQQGHISCFIYGLYSVIILMTSVLVFK